MSEELDQTKTAPRTTDQPSTSPGQSSPGPVPTADLNPEALGELPSGYGDMYLVARDPHWLFTYWDFDYASFPSERQLFLQVFRGDTLETEIHINEIARNWYIPVQYANADYRVVFGFKDNQGAWNQVGETGPTHTPPEAISTQWDTLFATVPFHLTFNLLVDVIEAAKTAGQPLVEALARLQQAALGNGNQSAHWGAAQLRILETLLGKDLLVRLSSMSSSELGSFLRADLSSHADSGSASELLAKGRLAQILVPAESSLFSGGILGVAESSETISSFGAQSSAEFSGGLAVGSESRLEASEILSSWRAALGSESLLASEISSAELVSQLSSMGLSSAELVSQLSSIGLSSAELVSALSSAGLSSAELFSQFGISLAELSSYGLSSLELSSAGLSSERLSALQLAALEMGALSSEQLSSAWSSSWSGLEFGPSSWTELISESSLFSGFGASWGGESFGLTQREFFMHVNAEVIFYGGTHPAAKVTVAGQPIQLQPDGTFRYHFKFPDEDFEIPIVAVSPDGKETRSAVLFFRRETTRQGDVGHTQQPAHLDTPMGAVTR